MASLVAADEKEEDDLAVLEKKKFEETPAVSGSEDRFQVFEKWLLDNGAKFPKLQLRDYGRDVRGVHTDSAIGDEEEIFSIPFRLIITVEMGKEREIGKKVRVY